MDDTPQSMAEKYAELARANFERDGELAPILAIHGEDQSAICLMKGSDDMPFAYGKTLSLAAVVIEPKFAITVTEVWMKHETLAGASEREARKKAGEIKRGDLSRMAEAGDETVRTALMTIAWTMDPREAYAVVDMVQDDKSYERSTMQGEQEGHMVECVIGGWKHGLTMPKPPGHLSPEQAARIIGMGGDVVGVLFQAPGTEAI